MAGGGLTTITVDDLLRAGACLNGVLAHKRRLAPYATAVDVDDLLLSLGDDHEAIRWLLRASGQDGYGDGYGDGDGDGYSYSSEI